MSLNQLPPTVSRIFYQLNLNCLFIRVPDGICTETIYQILGHLRYQCRTIYLVEHVHALLDIVPRDFTTIPLIKQRQPDAYNLLREEIFVFICEASHHVVRPLLVDYAYALAHGICPAHYMDIEYLCFNPRWRPAYSDHRYTCAGPRSL